MLLSPFQSASSGRAPGGSWQSQQTGPADSKNHLDKFRWVLDGELLASSGPYQVQRPA
jgi:hypothetical protein